ncbi:MAG: 16S rRNA processing protein RimM [Chitinophagia bacterium]
MAEDYIHIGKMVAPFGVNGQLILQHVLGKKTQLPQLEVLFIEEVKGTYLPYFIEKAQAKSLEETIISLEGIQSREAAQRLCSRAVWLREADCRKLVGKSAPLSLLGYQIVENGKELGEIKEVIEQPHQVLVTISLEGKDAYIPLHAASLQSVNHTNKTVTVQLPAGLLDIYRE